jgi:hypothetical protein
MVTTATARLTRIDPANGRDTALAYDGLSRLTDFDQLSLVGLDFSYNPTSQIAMRGTSNDTLAWTGHVNLSRS